MDSTIINEDIYRIYSSLKDKIGKFEGKKIFISGANGFIASYIVDLFSYHNMNAKKSIKMILVNKNDVKKTSRLGHLIGNKNIKFVAKDISKIGDILRGVDIVIHAASRATPKLNLDNPIDTIDSNVLALRKLLELSVKNNVKEFVYFSSADIYGNPHEEYIPTPENYPGNVDTLSWKSSYVESKRMGETLCYQYSKHFGIDVKILRIFNIYGPGLRDDGKIIAEFFRESKNGNDIIINSDGQPRRSFCYITDAIKGIILAIVKGKSGEAYNIGADNNNITIEDLAYLIKNETKSKVNIKILGERRKESIWKDNRCPDLNKIRGIGFRPEINLKDGLHRLNRWYDEKK
jgi:dTDP-glucose 4,6-dehydratase/UDP-glucuronate decarboxylase